ncbi:MAG: flagellar hook-basal body complex protein FliE [Clostridium sp.]|nr:flagellar hook-basal body complex protein FliE [Clostridium sp.]
MKIRGFAPNENIFQEKVSINENTSLNFGQVFKDALEKVNDKQIYSDKMTNELVLGGDVEVHEVMLAAEEAALSLQLAVQVRNKMTEAVKELTNLQI